LVLVVAVAGLLNLIWGFLPAYGSAYVGGTAPVLTTVGAYVPILLLIGGLVAAGAFLGGRRHDYQTAALSGSGAVGGLATFLMGRPPLAIGAILLLIFAVVQALAAVGALLAGRSASAVRRRAGTAGVVGTGGVQTGPAGPTGPIPQVLLAGGGPGVVGPPAASMPTGGGPLSADGGGPVPPGFPPVSAGAGPTTTSTPAPGYQDSAGGGSREAADVTSATEWPDEGDDPELTRIVRF
jgi:hypothetical protein